jgi:hypothetical protein
VTRNGTEVLYMDTSAFLKTVWDEAESVALSGFIGNRVTVSSSYLPSRHDEALCWWPKRCCHAPTSCWPTCG